MAGHQVKTRARKNYILYNLIADDMGVGSYEVDVCQGGTTYIIGNEIYQGSSSFNTNIISYNEETPTNPDLHLYVVNNTIVNNYFWEDSRSIRNVTSTTALVQNNIFVTTSSVLTDGPVDMKNNWITTDASLLDAPNRDFHLTEGSTGAIDLGALPDPGTGIDGTSLSAVYQYVHPCSYQTRPTNGPIDIGAYEYFTGVFNQPPTADAGTDQTVTLPAGVTLNGSATDDGLPDPQTPLTYTWSCYGGAGSVTFADPNAAGTTATFSVAGSYELRLEVSDGSMVGSDLVTITVLPKPNEAPTPDAGPDQTITFPGQATLTGSATDDDLPDPPNTVSYTWSTVSGPGNVTFGDPNIAATTASFTAPGVYVLQLTADDSELSATDTITVTVNPPLTVQAPDDGLTAYEMTTVHMSATGYSPAGDPLTYAWTQTAGAFSRHSESGHTQSLFRRPLCHDCNGCNGDLHGNGDRRQRRRGKRHVQRPGIHGR